MSDPLVFRAQAEPGTVRNTFTGIRPTFPNRAIHKLIVDDILPFRREIFMRPEFASGGLWEEPMVTLVQRWLSRVSDNIRDVTHLDEASSQSPLESRTDRLEAHINDMVGDDLSLEEIALAGNASHGDRAVPPANPQIPTIQFDFTGNHQDYPQPTPARLQSTASVVLVTGMDFLLVAMTNSPSSNAIRMVNRHDAADWITQLADLYRVAADAATNQSPFIPTGIRRSQLDSVWNANGQFDVPLSQGDGQFGEQMSAAAADSDSDNS